MSYKTIFVCCTLGPYCFLVTTSGAIQYGVPTIVVRFDCSGLIWAQKPKSAAMKPYYHKKHHQKN